MSFTSQAEALLAQAKQLDAYLESHSIPYPTFNEDTLHALPNNLQDLRFKFADDANNLRQLARGPVMSASDLIFSWTDCLALRIIYHWKLHLHVPLSTPISYPALSQASGLSPSKCLRAIRTAQTSHIFSETPSGLVTHTAISRLLATDPSFADAVGLEIDEIGPVASRLLEVWEEHGDAVAEPGLSAFSRYHGTEEGFFGYVGGKFPERARRFGSAMGFFTRDEGWDLRFVWEAWDWKGLDGRGGVVVDVGGGHGQVSKFLAGRTERVRFVVQDLGHVVEEGRRGLVGRIGFEAHDFMEPQEGGGREPSVFLLRWILHNWGDKYVVQILRGLVPAMGTSPGKKVLIFEYVLDDAPVKDSAGKLGLQVDMIMATLFNGQERTRKDFERLLGEADGRFVLENVRRPEGSAMSLVEVGWKGDTTII